MECLIVKLPGRVEIRHPGRKPLVFRADSQPSLERFLQECQVGHLGNEHNTPGTLGTQEVTLDPAYLMKSWWRDERFQQFFHPGASPDTFRKHRQSEVRKTVIRRPAVVSPPETTPAALKPAPIPAPAPAPATHLLTCKVCGERFDPKLPEHRDGAHMTCGDCDDREKVRRKRGVMVWTHKTAPTIQIEGGTTLTPEELAAMRRR